LQAIRDWSLLLDEAEPPIRKSTSWLVAIAGWALAGGMAIGLVIALWSKRTISPPATNAMRFDVPWKGTMGRPFSEFAVSPDGRYLVYFAAEGALMRLWLQPFDSGEPRPLNGTEMPFIASPNYPFWSHDSRFVVFASGPKLMKVNIDGGAPQALCDFPEGGALSGGTSNSDGMLLYGVGGNTDGGIHQIVTINSVTNCTTLFASSSGAFYDFPFFLPDGQHFLYSYQGGSKPENTGVYVGAVNAKPEAAKRLLPDLFATVFAPSSSPGTGHIVFQRDRTLIAQPFDIRRLELAGEASTIAELDRVFFFPSYSVATNGMMVYSAPPFQKIQPTWVDGSGNTVGTIGSADTYMEMALAPDGKRLAVGRHDVRENSANLWISEPTGVMNRMTFDKRVSSQSPTWSPDGAYLAFCAYRGGSCDLYRKPSNGAGEEELLYKSGENKRPSSWSGEYLLYTAYTAGKSKTDIWALPLQGERKPRLFLSTEFNERNGQFSPKANWVAYESDESGIIDVVVRPFPDSSKGKWVVSKGGGTSPRWRSDGRELYYLASDQSVMAVEVGTGDSFEPRNIRRLFKTNGTGFLDISPDGKRFLIGIPSADTATKPFTVLLNWQSALKK
jgi:Tol biopolymer transport system component